MIIDRYLKENCLNEFSLGDIFGNKEDSSKGSLGDHYYNHGINHDIPYDDDVLSGDMISPQMKKARMREWIPFVKQSNKKYRAIKSNRSCGLLGIWDILFNPFTEADVIKGSLYGEKQGKIILSDNLFEYTEYPDKMKALFEDLKKKHFGCISTDYEGTDPGDCERCYIYLPDTRKWYLCDRQQDLPMDIKPLNYNDWIGNEKMECIEMLGGEGLVKSDFKGIK